MTKTEIEELNLIQKLAKIRKIAAVVTKDKKGFNYTYADLVQISAKITAGMEKYHVSLIPSIVPGTSQVTQCTIVNTKMDKQGRPYDKTETEMLFQADAVFKWVNDDDTNDVIEVPWTITGSQSDPSQAFGSGLTYCTRYFLTNYFQSAQVDGDVDAYRKKQKDAEQSEDLEVAESIISEFDKLIKQYLIDHPDKKDEVKKFISKYAAKSNYLAIKDPSTASALLTEFSNKYLNENKELN